MKKILLIADCNSMWTHNFIKMMKVDYEVDLVSLYSLTDFFCNRYKKMQVDVFDINNKNKALKVIMFKRLIHKMLSENNYDYINIQYVSPKILMLIDYKILKDNRVVLSYWGSDILREKKGILHLLKNRVKQAYKVTFDNDDLMDKFREVYGYDLVNNRVSRLPLMSYEAIDLERKDIKNKSHIDICNRHVDVNKIIVCVGYNAVPQQQHIKVLEKLCDLPADIRNRLVVILQLMYGGNPEYIDDVKRCAANIDIDYICFDEYMGEEDIAKIRLVTDVYINAQTTDALSGSLCEYMYAETDIINASWLNYGEFVEYDVKCYMFDTFTELTTIVEKCVRHNKKYNNSIVSNWNPHNRQVAYLLRSEESCKRKWDGVFS